MTERAFVAFSGGGAKGMVHVGALKAIEDRGISLLGISGTSAGAIVAALSASGFRSQDIVDTASGRTIMDSLNAINSRMQNATDLFGPGGWTRIKLFRSLLRMPVSPAISVLALWTLPLIGTAVIYAVAPSWAGLPLLIGWLSLGGACFAAWRSLTGGLADASAFREALATLLQRKLFPNEPDRTVVMADFGVEGRPILKIVSANLTHSTLQLFSSDRTPDVAVADAVTASICLPLIFAPWRIDNELHVDGGIVSNLPAWPFDEERELDPEALTIAIGIDDAATRTPPSGRSWLPAAVRTALFGSDELNLRISGPTEQLALPTEIDLLDFDLSAEKVARQVEQVARAVGVRLDKRLSRLPQLYDDACEVTQALTLDLLDVNPGAPNTGGRVRVSVGRLERGFVRSLRMSYSVGYENDADEALLMPLDGSVAGLAWREGDSRFELYPLSEELDLPGPANRLRRKSRPSDLAWVMCIPILDKESGLPRLLVYIDGNMPVVQNGETGAALSAVEEAVKDFFDLILVELKDLEDGDGTEEREL